MRWSLPIKGNPHLLIAGLPGMGKTTCLLNLCRQMVTAGVHPIVFSYHQDIDERLVDLVASVRFVPASSLRIKDIKTRHGIASDPAMKLLDRFLAGDRTPLSRVITLLENDRDRRSAILDVLYPRSGKARRLGITGPPGSGKSTLTDRLTARLLQRAAR